ncbi:MAG: LysM peptidoglycan-binding domain-containing protein [Proteobacteria bacterium]|nr:LysM peptidoglycan-binding domain-containing protein [Pseudomonadota bacterium]
MKCKMTFFLVFALLSFMMSDLNVRDAIASNETGKVHTVVKGDTLWDISETYLENPFLWPKLWQWNDYISNPHYIYPGDPIKLYPPKVMVRRPVKEVVEDEPVEVVEEEVVEETEEEVVEEEPVVEKKEERYNFAELRSSGFINNEELKNAGKILESEDKKVMLSTGDIIYVTLSESDGAQEGDLYTVFKVGKEIIHPVTKRSRGRKIIALGYAQITSTNEDLATARITKSFDAIHRGDLIKPKEDITENVSIIPTSVELNGYIISSREDRSTFGERDIVYIDLGKKDGLEAGNTFIAYKEGKSVKDKASKRRYTLPSTTIGRLLVLHVKEDTSVAIILKSVEELRIGENIKSELD